jgi:rod shape-determining protein MreC
MRNLLRFLVTYHFIITFVILESFAVYFIVKNNNYQQARYVNFTQNISGYLSNKAEQLDQYLSLKQVNTQLVIENTALKNDIEKYKREIVAKAIVKKDTSHRQAYYFIEAKVVNNSVNKQYNYITLNRGREDGIKPEMGVIADNGVVGVVQSVTEHYSLVISVLNRQLKVSAKLKNTNFFGSFEWSGLHYQKGYLNDIPLHVKIATGDTIVTSGFSTIFPEGIPVGYVTEVEDNGGNFFNIELKIATDFKSLSYVYVVNSLNKDEQESLEKLIKND